MIDLPAAWLEQVRRVLRKVAPGCEVRAFGSRVGDGAVRYSDLDLALVAEERLDPSLVEALKDEFAESDLPITVDVVEWRSLPAALREQIGADYEVIQGVGREGCGGN